MSKRYLLIGYFFLGWQTASGQVPSGGDAKLGEQLFLKDGCYQCHGTVGQGARSTGPRLAPNTLPYDAFAQQVRKPVDQMPPYTERVLEDAKLRDIYAYITSLPEPPDPKDISILK